MINLTRIKSIVEEAVLTGEYTDAKQEYQFFETPVELAEKLVMLAGIQPGEIVLEPSAGKGRIAGDMERYTSASNCHCIELDPVNRAFLSSMGYQLVGDDFMNFNKCYDVIIANPPFTRQQDVDHINHMLDLANRKVVSIASASVMWRDNKKTSLFRDRIKSLGGTITPLPDDSFKSSGTSVRTCIVDVDINP